MYQNSFTGHTSKILDIDNVLGIKTGTVASLGGRTPLRRGGAPARGGNALHSSRAVGRGGVPGALPVTRGSDAVSIATVGVSSGNSRHHFGP